MFGEFVTAIKKWLSGFSFLFCIISSLFAEIVEEFVFEHPPFASCHASTIAETPSGKLLCAYFAGSEEGAKDVGIWLSVKTKDGWDAPQLIAKENGAPCWNPVLFSLPSGEIILFYKVGPYPATWSAVIKRSYDEGASWSCGEELPAGVLGPTKNRPLLLDDGTLLCGSSVESWRRWGCWIDLTKDFGKTWQKSTPINLEDNLFGIIQPALFQVKQDICLLARSYGVGFICFSKSQDFGKTWTHAVPIDLPNPNSAIDAVHLSEGKILLVYNHSSNMRFPLNLALSEDGLQWDPSLVLENEPGEYSYPSVIQAKDGKIHIVYTYNRKQIKHVSLESSDLHAPSG